MNFAGLRDHRRTEQLLLTYLSVKKDELCIQNEDLCIIPLEILY